MLTPPPGASPLPGCDRRFRGPSNIHQHQQGHSMHAPSWFPGSLSSSVQKRQLENGGTNSGAPVAHSSNTFSLSQYNPAFQRRPEHAHVFFAPQHFASPSPMPGMPSRPVDRRNLVSRFPMRQNIHAHVWIPADAYIGGAQNVPPPVTHFAPIPPAHLTTSALNVHTAGAEVLPHLCAPAQREKEHNPPFCPPGISRPPRPRIDREGRKETDIALCAFARSDGVNDVINNVLGPLCASAPCNAFSYMMHPENLLKVDILKRFAEKRRIQNSTRRLSEHIAQIEEGIGEGLTEEGKRTIDWSAIWRKLALKVKGSGEMGRDWRLLDGETEGKETIHGAIETEEDVAIAITPSAFVRAVDSLGWRAVELSETDVEEIGMSFLYWHDQQTYARVFGGGKPFSIDISQTGFVKMLEQLPFNSPDFPPATEKHNVDAMWKVCSGQGVSFEDMNAICSIPAAVGSLVPFPSHPSAPDNRGAVEGAGRDRVKGSEGVSMKGKAVAEADEKKRIERTQRVDKAREEVGKAMASIIAKVICQQGLQWNGAIFGDSTFSGLVSSEEIQSLLPDLFPLKWVEWGLDVLTSTSSQWIRPIEAWSETFQRLDRPVWREAPPTPLCLPPAEPLQTSFSSSAEGEGGGEDEAADGIVREREEGEQRPAISRPRSPSASRRASRVPSRDVSASSSSAQHSRSNANAEPLPLTRQQRQQLQRLQREKEREKGAARETEEEGDRDEDEARDSSHDDEHQWQRDFEPNEFDFKPHPLSAVPEVAEIHEMEEGHHEDHPWQEEQPTENPPACEQKEKEEELSNHVMNPPPAEGKSPEENATEDPPVPMQKEEGEGGPAPATVTSPRPSRRPYPMSDVKLRKFTPARSPPTASGKRGGTSRSQKGRRGVDRGNSTPESAPKSGKLQSASGGKVKSQKGKKEERTASREVIDAEEPAGGSEDFGGPSEGAYPGSSRIGQRRREVFERTVASWRGSPSTVRSDLCQRVAKGEGIGIRWAFMNTAAEREGTKANRCNDLSAASSGGDGLLSSSSQAPEAPDSLLHLQQQQQQQQGEGGGPGSVAGDPQAQPQPGCSSSAPVPPRSPFECPVRRPPEGKDPEVIGMLRMNLLPPDPQGGGDLSAGGPYFAIPLAHSAVLYYKHHVLKLPTAASFQPLHLQAGRDPLTGEDPVLASLHLRD